jgi:uncharacterized protein (TIGR03435 family)
MACKFGKTFWRLSLACLYLLAGPALLSVSATAQTNNAAHADQSRSDPVKTKEFKFEIASIKPVDPESSLSAGNRQLWGNTSPSPDGFRSRLTIKDMIMIAYADTVGIDARIYTPLLNPPAWSDDSFDVDARVSSSDLTAWRNQSSQHELLRSAMQDLLKQRCNLVIHSQPAELPDFKMVVGKKGPKFKATPSGFTLPPGLKLESGGVIVVVVPDPTTNVPVLHFYGATMGELASFQSRFAQRPVHDMTGLTGRYDFTLQTMDNPSRDIDEGATRFPLDELGLALKPGKYPGITLVIDHVEKPSPN